MVAAVDITLSQSAGPDGQDIDAICIGSGRFLRSVLVPFLSSNSKVAIFQTRGRTFLDSIKQQTEVPSYHLSYSVDTIEFDGSTTTSNINICAAGTLGNEDGKSQLLDGIVTAMKCISIIGIGVTEAGLQRSDNQCMLDLTELLHEIYYNNVQCSNPNGKIVIVNTDNVPNNGNVIQRHVLVNAERYEGEDESFIEFVLNNVVFLNSMVDRITSSRLNSNGMIPSCEPLPNKALVICDEGHDLPTWMNDEDVQFKFGVKIRHHSSELEADIALKLRVANGTHTALAHTMALQSLANTEALCDATCQSSEILLQYLDSLYNDQILPGAINDNISKDETNATWIDWSKRLQHPHFGLSTFFITQNGAAKCGIRLGPTIKRLVVNNQPLRVSMAFAVAAILRFLTPAESFIASAWSERISEAKERGVFVGWLDSVDLESVDDEPAELLSSSANNDNDIVTYADGLRYNLREGWYEFKCDCLMKQGDGSVAALPNVLASLCDEEDPSVYLKVVISYLLHDNGGNLQSLIEGETLDALLDEEDKLSRVRTIDVFVSSVATLYTSMVSGDSNIVLLKEMAEKQEVYDKGFATLV